MGLRRSGLIVFVFVFAWLAPAVAQAQRLHPLSKESLGPWYGSGCPFNGACGCATQPNATLADEFTCQIGKLRDNDIPISIYLFDEQAWSKANSFSWPDPPSCTGPDCCQWNLGDAPIALLRQSNVRAMLHFWGGCHTPEQYGRAYTTLGKSLFGFYMDEASSDTEARQAVDYLWSVMPGQSDATLKANQGTPVHTTEDALRAFGNVAYVGDCHYDWAGMKDGITRLFLRASLMPAPFNEFTGYWYPMPGSPVEETYFRRLHYGAFQVVMANTPFDNSDPWKQGYSPRLLEAYRYYSWLHKELIPYIYSYAMNMNQHPDQPVLRNANATTFSTQLGDELFVAYVTDAVQTLKVSLPAGDWIDYWNENNPTVSGTIANQPVPLGHEPVFIRAGAMIPMDVERAYTGHGTMESQGSLTVLVYPAGSSSFHHFDDSTNAWYTLAADDSADGLRLSITPQGITRPVIWRVGRRTAAPKSVAVDANGAIVVDGMGGTPLTNLASEAAVNGSSVGAWTYDANARRLIVKANVTTPAGMSGGSGASDAGMLGVGGQHAEGGAGGNAGRGGATSAVGGSAGGAAASGSPDDQSSSQNSSPNGASNGHGCAFAGLHGDDGAGTAWLVGAGVFALARARRQRQQARRRRDPISQGRALRRSSAR